MARPTFTVFRILLVLITAALFFGTRAQAQFTLTSLVTTTADPNLKNGWGIAFATGGPFWISDNVTGLSTVYDSTGAIVPTVVTVPTAKSGTGSPTGIVANSTTGFTVTQNGKSGAATFIFATLDGTISGWNSSVNATSAIIAVNNNAAANYTGLAIGKSGTKTFLFAANQAKNQIEIYDSTFKLTGTFTDTKLTGSTVYGVAVLKGQVYVTFSNASKGTGTVDVFSTAGKFVKTLVAATSTLKDPWGLAIAPASGFHTLSGTLLVGNVGDGKIHGYNLTTGKLVGTLNDKNNKAISVSGLWGLVFGGGTSGVNGATTQLFFSAGTGGYATGEFGVIAP